MSLQAARIAALERAVYELQRRVGAAPGGAPPRPELGEVTDDSPFQVTLTDGMVIAPATTFGGVPVVGDPALVIYPDDGVPVAVLQGSPSSVGALHVVQGPVTASVPNDVTGPTITVQVGQSVACLMVCQVQESTGLATAGGSVDGDSTGTATFTSTSNTDVDWALAALETTTVLVTRIRNGCTAAGTFIPEADFFISSGSINQEVTFFWMVF